MNRLKYICQNDQTDCGPACIASIFGYYGLILSIAKIREIAGTDREGTNALGLKKTCEHYGFDCKVVEVDQSVLTPALLTPCVAHLLIDNTLLHYVVIKKIYDNHIIIIDPAKGIMVL
ncbi:hypothetical protein AGMMS50284_7430 [Clostridia bacterium]|nr:hypothetical protein AGMMS50284_7430 [Clostridia bacterium]